MKTLKYYIAIICGFGFICIYSQTQTTIYTPLGSSVTAYYQIPEMSQGDKEDWSDYVADVYPNAEELNQPSATYSYNCHGYAWHVSEGGSNRWIGWYSWEQDDEDIYWEDASYIRVNSESLAEKISYYSDNHSAVQTSTQGVYISKWGRGPLMEHANNYGPASYLMNYRYYYAEPEISGPSHICYAAGGTFSVQNFSGVTYSWAKSSNLIFTSGTSGRTVSVKPSSSNTSSSAYVELTITVTAYNETNVIRKNFWAGKPGQRPTFPAGNPYPIQVNIDDYVYIYPNYQYDAQGATGSYWTTSGSITRLSPPTASVLTVEATSSGYGDFYLYGTNTCGTSVTPWHGMIYVSGGKSGGMKVVPVPADSYIEVVFDEDELSKAGLLKDDKSYDFGSNPYFRIINKLGEVELTQIFNSERSTQINTSKLQPGLYTLQLVLTDNVLSTNIIVSR